MELNRNQFFFAGLLVLMIGLQLRMVSSYVLTPETTRLLANKGKSSATASPPQLSLASGSSTALLPTTKKVVHPPEWLGWCLISVGAVLILHSLSMGKPD